MSGPQASQSAEGFHQDVARQLMRLASQLASCTPGIAEAKPAEPPMRVPSLHVLIEAHLPILIDVAKLEYRLRAARAKFIPEDMFGEPAWNMLIDLFIEQSSGRSVAITSATTASLVPPTTALRWVQLLEGWHYVTRRQSTADARRSYLELTEKGRRAVVGYLVHKAQALGWMSQEAEQAILLTPAFKSA